LLAAVIEQTLPDVFPNRVRATKPDRVRFPNLHHAQTPKAFDPQYFAGHLGQSQLPYRQPRFTGSARISQHILPPLFRRSVES
jgi:hypothetical protein